VRIRLVVCAAIFVGLITPAFAKKKTTPLPAPPNTASMDRNYVSALAAANRLLQAWQTGDAEAALMLLTDPAKDKISSEQLEKMFSPESAVSRGYQIARGRKLGGRRYAFPVSLLQADRTDARKAAHVRTSQIIVVDAGKDEWAVDRLP
jgi:hypothetical protein